METIGTMASGVAHNFNNIIGAIGGFSEMAELRTRPGSLARRDIGEIRQAVERARDLVDDILNFARSDQGERRPLDLAELILETARLLRATGEIDIGVQIEVPAGAIVVGNSAKLQQVIMNICNNAASAGDPARRVQLSLKTSHLLHSLKLSHSEIEAGRYLVIMVTDRGNGISPTSMPRIFDPFFTTRPEGTGLGLSTAWEVVADHGGSIHVLSHRAVGTRFAVWLPLAATSPPAKTDVTESFTGKTVLPCVADPQFVDQGAIRRFTGEKR